MSIEEKFSGIGSVDIKKLGSQAALEAELLEERKQYEARIEQLEKRIAGEEAAKSPGMKLPSESSETVMSGVLTEEAREKIKFFMDQGDLAGTWNFVEHLMRYDRKLPTLLNNVAFKDEVMKVYRRYFAKKSGESRRVADADKGREAQPTGATTFAVSGGPGRLGLLFIDLDNFKTLNDTQGHLAGDEALKKVAEILSEGLREADIKGRFGGEEFLVAIETEHEGEHFRVGEKIRRLIEAADVEYGGKNIHMTASIGAAELRPDETYEQLVERANWAMKFGKAHGKNRAVPEEMTEVEEWVAQQKSKLPENGPKTATHLP
jgi:diguanylate cyclase (GGDEF)-like protein